MNIYEHTWTYLPCSASSRRTSSAISRSSSSSWAFNFIASNSAAFSSSVFGIYGYLSLYKKYAHARKIEKHSITDAEMKSIRKDWITLLSTGMSVVVQKDISTLPFCEFVWLLRVFPWKISVRSFDPATKFIQKCSGSREIVKNRSPLEKKNWSIFWNLRFWDFFWFRAGCTKLKLSHVKKAEDRSSLDFPGAEKFNSPDHLCRKNLTFSVKTVLGGPARDPPKPCRP